MKINHHYYYIADVVDIQKCHEDAQRRRIDKRGPESSVVHNHERGQKCNQKCVTYLAQEA